jgi:RNA 3'-terminal phosphate cyclase (ATP)
MIEIDGSYGEGGGQILRTALALSCLTGKPFRIVRIRKGRRRPGLMPQHLAAVHAAARIAGAQTEGDAPGSTELRFAPGEVRAGAFSFDIGTAGSATLVLQAVIPPLLFAGGRSSVELTGGTHVPWSPSFHYLSEVFAPMLARLGGRLSLAAERFGFYPRGGGRVRCVVEAAKSLSPLALDGPGRLLRVSGVSAVANLPLSIARRQREAALALLGEEEIDAGIDLAEVPAAGKGTFLFLSAESEHALAGFTALGALGKRAEAVGEEAAGELLCHRRSGAALDPHLADQLAVCLALAAGESSFTTSAVTRHLLTNLWVCGRFLPLRADVEGEEGGPGRVRIAGG